MFWQIFKFFWFYIETLFITVWSENSFNETMIIVASIRYFINNQNSIFLNVITSHEDDDG